MSDVEEITILATQRLKTFLEIQPDRVEDTYQLIDTMKKALIGKNIEFVYAMTDYLWKMELESEQGKQRLPTCLKCSTGNCCYGQLVGISQQEWNTIKDFIKFFDIKFSKSNVKRQYEFESQFSGLDFHGRFLKFREHPEFKCPMLNKFNRCKVYSVRPLVCRNHYVSVGDTRVCKEDTIVPMVLSQKVEALHSAYCYDNPTVASLVTKLYEEFNGSI